MHTGKQFDGVVEIDQHSGLDRFLLALLSVLQRKTFSDITVRDLCQESALSRSSFYRYFTSKEDVVSRLAEELNLGFHAFSFTPPTDIDDPMLIDWLRYFTYMYHMRDWVRVLVKNSLWDYVSQVTPEKMALISPRTWNSYLAQDSERMQMMFEFINAGCVHLVASWCKSDFRRTPMEMAELVRYTLSGDLVNAKKK